MQAGETAQACGHASVHAPSGSDWLGPEGVEEIGEGKIRKGNANLSLVFGLWTVGGRGRYLEGVRNAATIILLNFCISS